MKKLTFSQVRRTNLPAELTKRGGVYRYEPDRDEVLVILPGRDGQQAQTSYRTPAWGWTHAPGCDCRYHRDGAAIEG